MERKIYEHCDGNRFEVDIPEGFKWIQGSVDEGCIIENNAGDQFIRIPLGYTAEGLFVRGFWVSRYEISKGKNETPKSVAGEYPWTYINYFDAVKVAENYGAHVISKNEYNRIPIWLLSGKKVSFEDMFVDGRDLGNFSDPFEVSKTGSNPGWIINQLADFWGNCYTWTSEKSELYEHHMIIRGGHAMYERLRDTPLCRKRIIPETKRDDITFRMVIRDRRFYDD